MKETTGTVNSMIVHRDRDCLGCRMTSGFGLIGSGLYVSYHSKAFQRILGKSIGVGIMYTIGSALIVLGTARVLDLPPFRKPFNHG